MSALSKKPEESQRLTERIVAQTNKIQWRIPSKISGKLIGRVIEFLKSDQRVVAAYLAEANLESARENFLPIIALSIPGNQSSASLLEQFCEVIGQGAEIQAPIDVCVLEEFPDFQQALDRGLARAFYKREA